LDDRITDIDGPLIKPHFMPSSSQIFGKTKRFYTILPSVTDEDVSDVEPLSIGRTRYLGVWRIDIEASLPLLETLHKC
jgi:hypothetical protein